MPALSVLFFFIPERSVLIVLVFYFKGMLEKVSMYGAQLYCFKGLFMFIDVAIAIAHTLAKLSKSKFLLLTCLLPVSVNKG